MNKKLGQILQECGAIKFGDFTLARGKSKYYIDVKMAATKPKILKLISRHIVTEIVNREIKTDYIACIELGAVLLGTVVSLDTDIPLIIIRKAQKDHGLKSKIVGEFEQKKLAILVEDVTTTGGSAINAARLLRSEGLIVNFVISVVDRDEGAEKNFSKDGLTLISLVKAKTILEDYEIAEKLKNPLRNLDSTI